MKRSHEGAGNRGEEPPGVLRREGAEEDKELRPEAGGREAPGGGTAQDEEHGQPGGGGGEPSHLAEVAGVGLGVEEVHRGEQHRRHDPVRDHLEDGAGEAGLVQRRHPQHGDPMWETDE